MRPEPARPPFPLGPEKFAYTPNPIPRCVVPASRCKPDNCSPADSPWESPQVPPAAQPSLPYAPSTKNEGQCVATIRRVIYLSSEPFFAARQAETSSILEPKLVATV